MSENGDRAELRVPAFRRFSKNRPALFGLVTILFMLLFSFVGGAVSPYGESQVFRRYEYRVQSFAVVAPNDEYRIVEAPGQVFPDAARGPLLLALSRGEAEFESGGMRYGLSREGDDAYRISMRELAASGIGVRGIYNLQPVDAALPDGFLEAFQSALDGDGRFALDGAAYEISATKAEARVYRLTDVALATKAVFTGAIARDYAFRLAAVRAMRAGGAFSVDGEEYTVESGARGIARMRDRSGSQVALASRFAISAAQPGMALPDGFAERALGEIDAGGDAFSFGGEYRIFPDGDGYDIRSEQQVYLLNRYEAPSARHWLGTDGNGMDVLTRLMYGGRVSLMIGLAVVLIQVVVGGLLGGISGYFGGWIDEGIMRLADVFSAIPGYPVYIILGAVLEGQQAPPGARVALLIAAMGLLNFAGTARLVRAQVLSLRGRAFMLAAEAAGLSVRRRLFRHLLPNVAAQLIVASTMALGNVILTEATLSFLGLGVKFPMASWGSIINAVSNVHVLTHYWFAWIPAGALILLTVLGFNFVGDGLRDALDPAARR